MSSGQRLWVLAGHELTLQLLLNLGRAVVFGSFGSIGGLSALELGRLVLDFPLEDIDVLAQRLLSSVGPAYLAFQIGYPPSHLLLLDLPGIAVALVSMPFGLEEAHDALECVLGGRRLVGAVALHVSHVHTADAVASIWAHRGTPRRWIAQLAKLIEWELATRGSRGR